MVSAMGMMVEMKRPKANELWSRGMRLRLLAMWYSQFDQSMVEVDDGGTKFVNCVTLPSLADGWNGMMVKRGRPIIL